MYPIEERLKNLEAEVSDLRDSHYYAHPFLDTTFHGIIAAPLEDNYLKVVQLRPSVASNGDLTFPSTNADTKPYDKVYVINLPGSSLILGKKYRTGEVIKYWCYSGTGDDEANIRGTYVTLYEAPKGLFKVNVSNPVGSAGSQSSPCSYVYDVLDNDTGETLGTGISVIKDRLLSCTMTAANVGVAYWTMDMGTPTIHLWDVNETNVNHACT